MLLVKPNNKYSHCYFLRYVPGLMLLIILFMFHTVKQNVIILMRHRLVYFVSFCVTKLEYTCQAVASFYTIFFLSSLCGVARQA